MAQSNEKVDFSGLFKLDVLIHADIVSYSFYEVGLKKFFAFSSDKELFFIYIDPLSKRFERNYDWDFVDNPVYCMCFEPSGTWTIILSEQKVLLVPFLPQFIPQNDFDHKWSLSSVTVLPLGNIPKPTSVVFWLTKESENILIIASKGGTISFYSLETQSVVGECKVSGEITDLQICFDDSLDLLALLISSTKSQQWKLVLEHRSYGYSWLQQIKANDRDKKDGFMSYIKQLSKDKITLFIQGSSKDEHKSQTVEYVLKPTEYLPLFRKGSNNWALTAQYVNGRHFLTAFELNEGTMILESPEEDTPSRTLRPQIKKDGLYVQGLWSQRLIYLLRKNEIEVHSSSFSVIQHEGSQGVNRDFTEMWSAELIGDVQRAHLMAAKDASTTTGDWQEPTFLCDLQLPRFTLQPCLIVTNCGAYILNTICEVCEWLVGTICRGGTGAEQRAAALGAALPPLLRAAADLLMSRGNIASAHYLYSLAQSPPDGWVARLGVFGRLHELSMFKQSANVGSLGNAAIIVKLLAVLIKMSTNEEEIFDWDVKFTTLNPAELLELASFAAAVGLWEMLPLFSIHRGYPNILLSAVKSRSAICRGALNCLLREQCVVPLLLEEDSQWLLDFIIGNCEKFDTFLLKCLCLWLNPLQDQLRPVMRDMKQGISTVYTAKMTQLISTFVNVACAVEAREPCQDIHLEVTQPPSDTWKNQVFTPRRSLTCGLAHWAVVSDGNARVMMASTPVNTELIGRVIDVACGRHHTLILTENGLYSAGDNTFGQLGVGRRWRGAAGEAARASGGVLRVRLAGGAPLVCVAAGHYHSAAVDAGGRLLTWGWGVHGQLGLGNIDDQWTPQLVTKFLGRKVQSVGCGACHSVLLTRGGELWACGASVFGQLGTGQRGKASLPVRVALHEPVRALAAGYFHNLALTHKGEVYVWGASPQQVRAAAARRAAEPSSPTLPFHDDNDRYLAPSCVDTTNVRGRIVQISAGWHHSCIINNMGSIYTWGLNFDGQLGSGDRKQIQIPTEVKIRTETQPHTMKSDSEKTTDADENMEFNTKALVGCGGDFTVYIDDDGRIYSTGNTHLQISNEKTKGGNRVIMMKTTKRVIKIPASRTNHKFLFQPVAAVDMLSSANDLQRQPIVSQLNPLQSMKDFKRKSWADDVIMLLKPWINEANVARNLNMAAKLAYHNNAYSECLRLMLENLKRGPQNDCFYVQHSTPLEIEHSADCEAGPPTRKDEVKITITNVIAKRIKEVSLAILNDVAYNVIDPSTFKSLPCCCDELKYLLKKKLPNATVNIFEQDLSGKAADVIDKLINIFPVDAALWEICFRLSKDFYINNSLSITELERVLRKYMESNATTMITAILYSKDCSEYSEILSPKFYLNMCNQVMDTWG